jgi:cell division protease FtsH
MDHQDQASAASIDAPPTADGQLPEQSRHVLKGRADVERVRRRKLGMRLVRAIVVLGALDLWMVSRSARGMSTLPHLPHIDPLVLLPLLIILPVLVLSLVMVLPLLAAKSPVRLVRPEEIEVGLDEVVGLDSQVDEVKRTLDVFLAYKTFREHMGGNPRRGVLFEGPPGTGKTYLAKAMAKQAGVPFLFASASQFQNVYFGMTQVRLRRFFKKLRKAAENEGGAIGFIEEIDSIAGSRGGVAGMTPAGGRSSALSPFGGPNGMGMDPGIVNELLVQMQSFDTPSRRQRFWGRFVTWANGYLPSEWRLKAGGSVPYHNVLIIAATNRASTLDPALLRPGRFDRRLVFDPPSRKSRRDLVDFFMKRKAHASELDDPEARDRLTHEILGYTPAMIEHLFDEALVVALRKGHDAMTIPDVYDARLTSEIGLKQPVTYTTQERVTIATHEAGHATVAHLLGEDQRLEVLTIIKRQQSLGLLARSDIEERFTRTRSEMEASIAISLGGMAAEEVYFGESGTGPSGDLASATQLAATMVGSLGMGRSLMSFHAVDDGPINATNLVGKVMSDPDAKREAEAILTAQKTRALEVIGANRDIVEALRDALVRRDELIGDEILAVIHEAVQRRHNVVVLPESEPVRTTPPVEE